MSVEWIEEMQPKIKKAGERQSETRDTVIPHLVTEHLVSFLRAVGVSVSATTLSKNTREEVIWKDAKNPWRRSPMWLLLRVSMQLAFSRLSPDPLKNSYKPFMIFLMSRILKLTLTHPSIESDFIYAMNAKLSQRLLKLQNYREELWFSSVWDTMTAAQSHIKSCWKSVMASSCAPADLSMLREINPAANIIHELPVLDQFIHQVGSLSTSKTRSDFRVRGSFPIFDPGHLPHFSHLVSMISGLEQPTLTFPRILTR